MPSTLTLPESIRTPELKRAYNEGLFTRVAVEYDRATRAMSLGRDQAWKRMLVAALPALPAPNCVDLACGTGDVTFELARKYPRGRVLGTDLTPAMLEVARQRNTFSQVDFACHDMCRLELPAGWADIVTGSYALRNAPVLDDALAEIHRVLKPGGCAAFLDFSKSHRAWLQPLQTGLLKHWGGFWGLVVHGRPEHAYLGESLRQFPDRLALRQKLVSFGFVLQFERPLYLGVLEILVVRKLAEASGQDRANPTN